MMKVIGIVLLFATASLSVKTSQSPSSSAKSTQQATTTSPTTNPSQTIHAPTQMLYHPCTCAAIDTAEYEAKKTVPLTEISLNILPLCGEKGSALCTQFCKDLAEKIQKDPNGGNEFCKNVKKDIKNVHVHVFSKSCDGDYKYTGLKCDEPVCCDKGASVSCSK